MRSTHGAGFRSKKFANKPLNSFHSIYRKIIINIIVFQTLTYVAEITTPSLRGILASTSTVAVISGILVQFLLGTFFTWRTVALVSCIMPIISFISLFFVPESPHWLLSKKRYDDAKKSIAWLRGWVEESEIEQEYMELIEQTANQQATTTNQNKNEQNTIYSRKMQHLKLYTKKSFLWPFGIVSFAFFLGHFSGMTTLQTYAVKIFASLNAPINKYYATIFLGIAEVAGCILSAILIHYVGKRFMNFFSLIGCGVSFMVAASYSFYTDVKYLETSLTIDRSANNWLPMTFLIAAAFFSHAGIRILPWMLIGEVYYSEIRAPASGVSGAASYIFGFVSNKIFLSMVNSLTLPGTFWFYSCVSFIGCIVLYFVLPETEGKTLYEITEHFAGIKKIDNKVHRKNKKHKRDDDMENGNVNKAFSNDKADVIGNNCEESKL